MLLVDIPPASCSSEQESIDFMVTCFFVLMGLSQKFPNIHVTLTFPPNGSLSLFMGAQAFEILSFCHCQFLSVYFVIVVWGEVCFYLPLCFPCLVQRHLINQSQILIPFVRLASSLLFFVLLLIWLETNHLVTSSTSAPWIYFWTS